MGVGGMIGATERAAKTDCASGLPVFAKCRNGRRRSVNGMSRTDISSRIKAAFLALARDWAAVIGIALLLALFGPYETFTTMRPASRMLFWLVAAIGTSVLVKVARWALQRWKPTKHWPFLWMRLAAAVLGSVPAALLMSQFYAFLSRTSRTDFGLAYIYVLLPTAFFTLLLTGLAHGWLARPRPEAGLGSDGAVPLPASPAVSPDTAVPTEAAVPVDPVSAFLARHVSRFAGGTLLALESEDHYLRVHTDRGSDLILMRLRDAIAQLATTPGLQVHRSFWVARAGVAQISRRGAQTQLLLRNGLSVPVSRTYMPILREAGWLDGGAASPTTPL